MNVYPQQQLRIRAFRRQCFILQWRNNLDDLLIIDFLEVTREEINLLLPMPMDVS